MRCRRNSNGPPQDRFDLVLYRCIFTKALRKGRYGQDTRRSRDRGQLEERFDQSKGGERTRGAGARRTEAQHRRDRRIADLQPGWRRAAWTEFRDRIRRADAVLFVTPEHNRSVPAALKNGLDIGSRPYGKSAWSGKPGAVVSASPGAIGAFGANHHLRQSLTAFCLGRRGFARCRGY